jgi:[acyl-carrier-protein] S-malonyltransferase
MRTALLFAGQGTQYVGMGRVLHAQFPEARAVFDAADAALTFDLTRLIFEGPESTLTQTENTQPAVLTVACAAWAVIKARGFRPTVVAGHSLGEYGALVAAEVLDLQDAVRLTRLRGQAMQRAVAEGVGAMAAIQRLDDALVAAACATAEGVCDVAAYNAPGLVVVSGEAKAVQDVSERVATEGALVTPLAVSAPFHSRLLAPAAVELETALRDVPMHTATLDYVANVDAAWLVAATPDAVRARLVAQVVGAVRWRQSLEQMVARGIERFWHLGPGRSNLTHVKRLARRAHVASFDEAGDLDGLLRALDSSDSPSQAEETS